MGAAAPLSHLSYFSIFDGHGGSGAAEFAGERLWAILAAEAVNYREGDLGILMEALQRAFVQTEEEWLDLARAREFMDGSTAAVALVDRERSRCIVGNVGDSEIILGARDRSTGQTTFLVLTEVHHPKHSVEEAARVEAAGGRVWRGRLAHPSINPQVMSLAVSRAIGDLCFKDEKYTNGRPSGLIADPYIAAVELASIADADEFLIIACDGLWDAVEYSEAAEFAATGLGRGEDAQSISAALARRAQNKGSS